MNRRWVCNDVWMDILPSFDHAQLGLKMALLSDRFDALVDTHFDGKNELTIWKTTTIKTLYGLHKSVLTNYANSVHFLLSDHPLLPSKIRFKDLQISYIDHSVIAFLRSKKHIRDSKGTNFGLWIPFSREYYDQQRIWKVFVREVWPIFEPIRHLTLSNADHLNDLRRLISPTILTDLNQLNSIDSNQLYPAPNANSSSAAGQALFKWLHTPSTDDQPKRLYCRNFDYRWMTVDIWASIFKKAFLRAITSVSYKIRLELFKFTRIEPFESVNERTNEQMTLVKEGDNGNSYFIWLLERCKIGGMAATVQWEDENSDNVHFMFYEASRIAPGSTIHSDCWAAYNQIAAGGQFNHLRVNHRLNFVDPQTGAHTQNIERLWRSAKRRNKEQSGTHRQMLDSYFCEFLWRHSVKRRDVDAFEDHLQNIAIVSTKCGSADDAKGRLKMSAGPSGRKRE
ncbi:hypothetical protein niasHS_004539 [Heterodera schachtii]|uniref:ISXO2-like transposase domain-containing protein n=1 Tax=Heterodera schachtii TaxID=97005 RepID=A0ABD2JN25_HETSC